MRTSAALTSIQALSPALCADFTAASRLLRRVSVAEGMDWASANAGASNAAHTGSVAHKAIDSACESQTAIAS